MSPAKTSFAEQLNRGDDMEMRVARLWFWEGYFSRNGINLKRYYHPEPLLVTDLDLLAYDFGPSLQVIRTIGEVKTGRGKSAPKPLDRIIWLRGLKELVGVDYVELVSSNAPSERARSLARSIGVDAQSQADIERREKLADVASVEEVGSHGACAFQERLWVHKHCRNAQLLERAFWFLRSEVWFHDQATACKRLIGLYGQLASRWTPEIDDQDSRALRWLLAETVSILTLNTVAVASEALRSAPDLLMAKLGERLSAGLASADVMRRIATDVDKYLGGLLRVANVPTSVTTNAMGALHPEAPPWTEQFVDLVCRIASYRETARILPRQIDLLVHERIVWRRDIDSVSGHRVALADPQSGRLIRLLAAFLRSQSAYVEVVDRALTTDIKTASRAPELAGESDDTDVEEQTPMQASLLDARPQSSPAQ